MISKIWTTIFYRLDLVDSGGGGNPSETIAEQHSGESSRLFIRQPLTLYIRRAEAERQLDGDLDPEEGSNQDGEGLGTGDTIVDVKIEPEPKNADVTMGD